MPFVKKPNSQTSQTPSHAQSIFIGRIRELDFFVHNILKPEEPIFNIVSIWGQGGVGKSTLLKQIMNQMRTAEYKDNCLAALVDERHVTPASMMERWADQLSISGRFGKALRRYWEALDPSSTERNTLQGKLVKKAPDLAGAALEGIPFAGSLLHEGVKVTTEHLLERYRLSAEKQEEQRWNAPIRVLTQAFVAELNRTVELKGVLGSRRAGHEKRILLCFDTFEHLAPFAVPWLLDLFLEAEISSNIVLVVVGRDSIERSTSDGPKRWLQYFEEQKVYSLHLKNFTEEETLAYLAERGTIDPDRTRTIWHLSQGLPLYLGLLTTHTRGDVDPTKDVVDNFLRWIADDEQVKRRLAFDTALLSRPFTQDDLEAFAYIPEESRPMLYRWLTTLPFVQSMSQDGRYRYHEVAQDLFCRHLAQHAPKQYYAARRGLADYYQQLLEAIGEQGGKSTYRSGEWLELVLALAFQWLLLPDEASHIKAAERLLDAFEQTTREQDEEIAAVLRQISQEQVGNRATSHARHEARRLLHFVEAGSGYQVQKKLMAANDLLEKFLHEPTSTPKLLAHLYYNRGWAFIQLSEYQQALKDFERTLELDPSSARAFSGRGSVYWRLKEYQQALDAYNRALELDPASPGAYDARGWVYYLLGEYQQALKDFDRTLELDSDYFDAYRGRSHVCRELKDYQLAVTPLNQAIERSPESSRLYDFRGWTHWDFGKYQQALKDFDCSIELDPTRASSYHGRFWAFYDLKQYEQALDALDRCIELEPDDASIYSGRGLALFHLEQYQQALEVLNYALELDPTNAQAHKTLGHIYRELKEYQRSLEEFDRLVKVSLFGSGRAYFERGYAYLWMKDVRQAKADFTRCGEIDPRFSVKGGWMSEWCSLCQERASAEAPERLEAIALTNTEDYAAYLCRGVALWLRGNLDEALTEMEKAIPLQTEKPDAYFWKGLICATLGREEEAIAAIENALKLELPPVLLTPLRWLEQDRPDFFGQYVGPLLAQS
jgi:tetratricopeptide (TPR) repeat protein/GTPase SAR1 family protein